MKTLRSQRSGRQVSLSARLFNLERNGRYAEGLKELADIWPDSSAYPNLGQFDSDEAAEILLRCGSLLGFHGHNIQEPNSQERSRDLLMTAQNQFLSSSNVEKAAECDNYLALTYWRTGELNEAQIWIDESMQRALPSAHPVRLFTRIVQCLVNIPPEKDAENLELLRAVETEFLSCEDDSLLGDYFNHCGIALGKLGRTSEALEHFEFARYHHQRSGHRIYLGTVENNLAGLYRLAGRFDRAHAAIDNAVRLFRACRDKTREGFSLETRAAVLIDEGRHVEALKTVEMALSILRQGENSAYLIETLMTKAKVLVYLDNFPDAIVSLIDAVNIARVQTGEDSAKRLVEELERTLQVKNRLSAKTDMPFEDGSFELLLPASIGQFADYRGVWIYNDRLASIGLTKGSLGVVAKTDVKRGDLAAVTEIETGEVTCGFYDVFAGIVSLEGPDGEPHLFDEVAIRVLGKVVGVCRENKRDGGRMVVETLKF